MAIIAEKDINTWPGSDVRDALCYYCGHPLTLPTVQWHGFGEILQLHPECVVELTIRLYRDVHQIECERNRYVTGPRTLGELRAQLLAEEGRS